MVLIPTIVLPIYGILMMTMLLDVHLKTIPLKKRINGAIFALIVVTINVLTLKFFGRELYRKYYMLFVQIPVFIYFWYLSKFQGIKLLFVLLTSITFATIPMGTTLWIRNLWGNNTYIMLLGSIFSCCVVLATAYKFLRANFIYMLEYGENKVFSMFCIIPSVYYLYTYFKTHYNFVDPFSTENFIVKYASSILVFSSYILLLYIFKSVREKQLLENEKNVMHLQLEATLRHIDELKTLDQQTLLHRHDMRHHLALISSYLTAGDTENLKAYLRDTQNNLDTITPLYYCQNQTANLVIGSFVAKGKALGISLDIRAKLPDHLHVTDTELCTILSNGLENAIKAASHVVDDKEKYVRLLCEVAGAQLLISIANPYAGQVLFENGIPQATKAGHGFGIKSMVSIVEKYRGLYSFEEKDGVFLVRLVL